MNNDFLLICGPCSAESEEQVLNTARQLKESVDIDYFRAGIWKPRTRPGTFEGVGELGLSWLQRVQNELGINAITEVANSEHVNLIAKYGIKSFWVGARTVANPFSVQEIAEAGSGDDFTVFVKNPINPDVDLWLGAIERFLKLGYKNVVAVCRGFYPYVKTHLRNEPHWEIPIELARRMPNIKIICDPSHIAGDVDYVAEISQQAIDLDMSGLMIESHCCPQKALSDAKQQLTPQQLKQILSDLNFKTSDITSAEAEINSLRGKIDIVDYQVIDLLRRRFDISNEIGRIKKQQNIAILQKDRWKTIVESRLKYAEKLGLSHEFILEILEEIHKESIKEQRKD